MVHLPRSLMNRINKTESAVYIFGSCISKGSHFQINLSTINFTIGLSFIPSLAVIQDIATAVLMLFSVST